MFPPSITLVTLGVRDLDRARRFYAALGWEATEATETVVFIQLSGQVLALFGIEDLADDQQRAVEGLGTGAMTLARNFATEAEVDAAFDLVLRAGGVALKPPQKVEWGGYSGYFADPDGHVWELALNPFWPLAADGTLTLPVPLADSAAGRAMRKGAAARSQSALMARRNALPPGSLLDPPGAGGYRRCAFPAGDALPAISASPLRRIPKGRVP